MARPPKNTVDYFSHDADASGKKTLSTLFNHFQHEGISAWWQLLEIISDTENHVIDIRNSADWEYLAARMRFQPERLKQILDKIAELDAIDQELYRHGLIWCQKLVDRLVSVYKKRNQPLPLKPVVSGTNNPVSVTKTPVSVTEIPQTKLNKTKLNKSKENKGGMGGTPDGVVDSFNLPEWIDLVTWDAFLEVRKKKKAPNTPHALSLIVKELERLKAAHFNPQEILNQSIMRGWTGVFPIKNQGGQNGKVYGQNAGRNEGSRAKDEPAGSTGMRIIK